MIDASAVPSVTSRHRCIAAATPHSLAEIYLTPALSVSNLLFVFEMDDHLVAERQREHQPSSVRRHELGGGQHFVFELRSKELSGSKSSNSRQNCRSGKVVDVTPWRHVAGATMS